MKREAINIRLLMDDPIFGYVLIMLDEDVSGSFIEKVTDSYVIGAKQFYTLTPLVVIPATAAQCRRWVEMYPGLYLVPLKEWSFMSPPIEAVLFNQAFVNQVVKDNDTSIGMISDTMVQMNDVENMRQWDQDYGFKILAVPYV